MRQSVTFLAACIPLAAGGQGASPGDLLADTAALIPPIESAFDCRLSVHGTPELDDFAQQWLIAYSAAGAECDDAAEALQRAAATLDVLLVRRPTLDQVKALIGEMTRTVRRGFSCRIALREEPKLDEGSGLWTASVSIEGADCDGAWDELVRQGRTFRIAFLRAVAPRDLLLR